jgi:hypothetical protein
MMQKSDLRLRSLMMIAPETVSCERTKTVFVMRSTDVVGEDAAGLEADSCSENPELSCSRKACVRSCSQTWKLLRTCQTSRE